MFPVYALHYINFAAAITHRPSSRFFYHYYFYFCRLRPLIDANKYLKRIKLSGFVELLSFVSS